MTGDRRKSVLIVNADDFGLSGMINRGVELAHQKGILTSATLMAVGPAFDDAVAIAHRNPKLGVGVHLTLIEEAPLSEPGEIGSLLHDGMRFHKSAKVFGMRYLAGSIRLDEVRLELERQVQRVVDAGITITHFDSHQHVHLIPGISRTVEEIGKKFGIDKIRRTNEKLNLGELSIVSSWSRMLELGLIRLLNLSSRGTSLVSTDRFAGFMHGGKLDEQRLLNTIACIEPGQSFELMCHPGCGEETEHFSHWGYQWNREFEALVSASVIAAIARNNISLVNWSAIQLSEEQVRAKR